MKFKIAMLLLVGVLFATIAAPAHSPPKQKTENVNVKSQTANDHQVVFGKNPFNTHAVLLADYPEIVFPDYVVPAKIGDVTGQLHESNLVGNYHSLNRCLKIC